MKTFLVVGASLALLLASGAASAAKKSYIAPDLDGAKEKPVAVNTAATGEARFTYDDVTKKLCGHITMTPSAFVATASHLHIGNKDTAGPVGISFDGFTGQLMVNLTLTTDEAQALNGDSYVNVHSAAYPGGEVRDQLVLDGDTSAADEPCEGEGPVDAGTTADAGDPGTPGDTKDAGTVSDAGKTVDVGTPDPGSAATTDAGKSSTSATPAATDDGGCNATGSSNLGSGLGLAAGLGLALAMASRKRKERS